ncbi:MAG TPA: hypothetical protein VHV53_06845 [Solirubrobacterales bacterium]|nr:hypothetical protein [Solirubrobacterales bacterium]
MRGQVRRQWVVVLAVLLLGSSIGVAVSSAAEEPTRAEYVARLEQICEPGSDATERAVRGVRGDVRAERLAVAARKLARAQRIFTGTVRSISVVPRPAADRTTLSRWFAALGKEEVYLGQMVKTLRANDVAGFERVSARFIHEGNKANNAVVSFGFNYCSFKPSRLQ